MSLRKKSKRYSSLPVGGTDHTTYLADEAELNTPRVREGRSENERDGERRSRGRTQTGPVADVRRPSQLREKEGRAPAFGGFGEFEANCGGGADSLGRGQGCLFEEGAW